MTWGHSYSVPGLSLSWKYGLSAAGPDILMYNSYSLNESQYSRWMRRARASCFGWKLASIETIEGQKAAKRWKQKPFEKHYRIHGQFSREGYQQVQCC